MTQRPKVLLLTHRLPYPPNRGDRIRAFHMLQFLSEHADVSLASVADESWEPSHKQVLSRLCNQLAIERLPPRGRWLRAAVSLGLGRSATVGAFSSVKLKNTIADWTSKTKFDAAVVYCSSMGQYCKYFRNRPNRILVDLVDVDSQKWREYAGAATGLKRMLYRQEANQVRRLERNLSNASDAITVVSQDEAELFRSCHPTLSAHAISCGVDSTFFSPHALDEKIWRPLRTGKPQLVFVGALDYLPNIQGLQWFCDSVLPLLRVEFPEIVLEVVGRNPTAAVRKLGQVAGVRIVGELDDIRPHLLASDIAIAPLQIARGIQNKVLEAMACGRPVIATQNAATGIDRSEGLIIVDTPSQWLESVRSLNREHCTSILGAMAREAVVSKYSWPAKLQPLLGLLGLDNNGSALAPP